MSGATVWVSVSSHRARGQLDRAIPGGPGREYGVWPEKGWPRGEYYQIPAGHIEAARTIKGLRVLQGEPKGGRIFKRWSSAELGGPERGNWPVPGEQ